MKSAQTQTVYHLTDTIPDPRVVRMLSEKAARENLAVPLRVENGTLVVASADNRNAASARLISQAARRSVRLLPATYPEVRTALDKAYGSSEKPLDESVAEDLCLRLGYIHAEQVLHIREKASKNRQTFLESGEALGLIDQDDLAEVTAILSRLPYLREKSLVNLVDLSDLVPWDLAQKEQITPLFWAGGHLVIGSPKPATPSQIWEISNAIHLPVQYVILARDAWEKVFRRFYLRGYQDESPDLVIAQSFVQKKVFTADNLEGARRISDQNDQSLEDVLLNLNLVNPHEWFLAKARYYKVAYHDLLKTPPLNSPELNRISEMIPLMVSQKLQMLPLRFIAGEYEIGFTEPTQKKIRTIEQMIGHEVVARLVDRRAVDAFYDAWIEKVRHRFELELPSIHEYAVYLGSVTPLLLDEMYTHSRTSSRGSDILVTSGLLDEVDLAELQGLQCNLPFARLEHVQIAANQLSSLPRDLMAKLCCFPLFSTARQIWVAVADPLDGAALSEVETVTGKYVWPVITPRPIIQSVIDRHVAPGQKAVRQEEILIVEKLVEEGFLTQLGASRALQLHHSQGKPLDMMVADQTTYPPEVLVPVIAKIIGIQAVSLALIDREEKAIDPLGGETRRKIVVDPVDSLAVHLIDLETAQKLCVLPFQESPGQVVIAFADPDYKDSLAQLQTKISLPITPVLAARHELEDAIQRTLGHRNLGTYLLMDGLITRAQLNRALDLARRTGVRLGRALVNRRYITQKQLSQYIAKQSGFPYVDLTSTEIDEEVARKIPSEMAYEHGIFPIRQDADAVTVAIIDPLDNAAIEATHKVFHQPVNLVVVTDVDFDEVMTRIYSRDYLTQSVSELLTRSPDDSAFQVLTRGQSLFFIGFLLLSLLWIFLNYQVYFIVLNSIATFFYLVFSAYKLYLIYKALDHDLEVPVSQEEIDNLKDSDLPIYTILIPVFHEAEMLTNLLEAVGRFDYPSTKLDIRIVMEEGDDETIQAYYGWNPPSHFHAVIVPSAQPKTKPKACNYGLIQARGEYVVIYDAEDLPDVDQLKKVIIAFRKSGPDVVCIQSKLNYYNHSQNLLTRWFTIEYSMWFDLFLPGLDSSGAPIPLGGTSNHFVRDALLEIGAWDPYNVTEDADLGIRLYKRGYKTAIIDSTTYEEANSKLGNWIRQRSRWIKGYIQTYLVHMRHPVRLFKEVGLKGFLGFQFVVGGNFFASLLNPIYWILTSIWFIFQWKLIQLIFPSVIFYLGALCLFLGNFAFTYINVAGAMRRNYYGMVKYALLSPLYWALASIAAWRGFIQLFVNPFYWEKTVHGLHIDKTAPPNSSTPSGPSQPS